MNTGRNAALKSAHRIGTVSPARKIGAEICAPRAARRGRRGI
jgi:hypothetical protein